MPEEVIYILLILGGALLIGLCAQLAVGWPVPITGQTFAVLMIAMLLGARRASFCILTYITLGVLGLPVFAHAGSGLTVLLGPTGGYLIGFIPAAFLTGFLAEKKWDRTICSTVLAMALGNITLYTFGLIWLSYLVGTSKALTAGLYPFIIGDILKIALAAAILPTGWKLLGRRRKFRV